MKLDELAYDLLNDWYNYTVDHIEKHSPAEEQDAAVRSLLAQRAERQKQLDTAVAEHLTITAAVRGGGIYMLDIPQGSTLILRDYDVDGYDDAVLQEDADGDRYHETVFSAEDRQAQHSPVGEDAGC